MTDEQVNQLAAHILGVDGGCSVCVRAAYRDILAIFPDEADRLTEAMLAHGSSTWTLIDIPGRD